MPIEIEWDEAQYVVRTKIIGTITEAEMVRYFEQLWARPDRTDFDEITDCRAMDSSLMTPEVMLRLTRLSAELNRERRYFRVATVVAGRTGRRVGRIYVAYREPLVAETCLFESIVEAEAWLEAGRRADRDRPQRRSALSACQSATSDTGVKAKLPAGESSRTSVDTAPLST